MSDAQRESVAENLRIPLADDKLCERAIYIRGEFPRQRLPNCLQEFSHAIDRARKQAGLTQVEVDKRLGKAHSFISKCELGERLVDFVEVQQLTTLYKKDLSFFCD